MITYLKCLINMDQLTHTGWLGANIVSLYIGLKSQLMLIQTLFTNIEVETIKNIALLLGLISTALYIFYVFTKIYHKILETKILKRNNDIRGLFQFNKNEQIKK